MAMNNIKSEALDMNDIDMINEFDMPDDIKDEYETVESDNKTPGEVLDDFCAKLQDVNSTIPDPVMLHYMKKAGFIMNDPRLVKILSLASQKFLSEIVNDCMQYHKIKTTTRAAALQQTTAPQSNAQKSGASGAEGGKKQAPAVLTLEDLTAVLQDYGINIKKPYYFM